VADVVSDFVGLVELEEEGVAVSEAAMVLDGVPLGDSEAVCVTDATLVGLSLGDGVSVHVADEELVGLPLGVA
jgi:hypothetical protein